MLAPVRDKGRVGRAKIYLDACPRCNGDMIVEEWLGDTDLVCLQCGHRRPVSL